jgi:hypothetical protein
MKKFLAGENDTMWCDLIFQPMYKRWLCDDRKWGSNGELFLGVGTVQRFCVWKGYDYVLAHILKFDLDDKLFDCHPDLRTGAWASSEKEFMLEFMFAKYLWITKINNNRQPTNWKRVYAQTTKNKANAVTVCVFARKLTRVFLKSVLHSCVYHMLRIMLDERHRYLHEVEN